MDLILFIVALVLLGAFFVGVAIRYTQLDDNLVLSDATFMSLSTLEAIEIARNPWYCGPRRLAMQWKKLEALEGVEWQVFFDVLRGNVCAMEIVALAEDKLSAKDDDKN